MFRIFIAAFVAIMISVPSCHCPVDPDQFEHTRQCMGKVVELATSEQCLGQCLAASWVGCAMGCAMGLIDNVMPVCSEMVFSFLTKPELTGYGATMGENDLVCKKDAPTECFDAEVRIRNYYTKVSKGE